MTDSLTIFGTTYNGVTGIVATDTNSTDKTYIRPQGTKSISANGTGIDVTEYASVDVAVPSGTPTLETVTKSYTPTESQQTETITPGVGYDGIAEVDVTVGAISSSYVGSGITRRDSTDLSASGATVSVPSGYYASAASKAVASGTEGTPTATKGAVSSHSVTVTPSVTNAAGYISGGTHTGTGVSVSASELVSGTYTVSGSGTADVTNYATAYVASADPYVSCFGDYYTENNQRVFKIAPYVEISVEDGDTEGWLADHYHKDGDTTTYNAVPANTTVTPSTSSQTIGGADYMMEGAVTVSAMPSGTAGTPTATKSAVSNHSVSVTPSVTNTTGYITGSTKTGTAVTVTASELVSGSETKTENGTYDVTNLAEIVVDVSGGGSSTIQVGTTTKTLTAAASSISFTGLSGSPTSFAVTSSANVATSTNGVTAVVWDGTNLHGQTVTNQVTADTGFSKSYSGGTLTITATTAEFQANEYKLVYTYSGSSSDIHTADVQVGSGATSITFSSLSGRPIYWSCIFKSDFSTSSGYQRVIEVVNDGTSIYGMAMDSSAKAQTSWSQTYSGGNLTISSTGTNNGGYFHQPGYYQLTYAVDASAPQYQTKTVSPTTSQQTVLPDSGYDALEEVIVNAMPSMTLPNSASATSSGTSKATITPGSSVQYLNIPTGYNATAQYYTIGASGGGGSVSVETKTTTLQSVSQTISFSSLKGTPKYWFLRTTTQISSSSTTYYYIVDIRYNGTNTTGNSFRLGSTRRIYNITSGLSYTYSNGTLTVTAGSSASSSPGQFYNGEYELVYIY